MQEEKVEEKDAEQVKKEENSSEKKEETKDETAPSKPVPRKRYKEDFIWEEDVIGEGAFGEV